VKPCSCRFSVVGWRTASRRPVIRKTATPFFLARLNRSSVGLIATPILLTASAWELGPNVKLSALIAEQFDSDVSWMSRTIASLRPWSLAIRARRCSFARALRERSCHPACTKRCTHVCAIESICPSSVS
jgi:hypothetical protein